jgi:hypothetical protein
MNNTMDFSCDNKDLLEMYRMVVLALIAAIGCALVLFMIVIGLVQYEYGKSKNEVIALQETINDLDLEIGMLKKRYNPMTLSVVAETK